MTGAVVSPGNPLLERIAQLRSLLQGLHNELGNRGIPVVGSAAMPLAALAQTDGILVNFAKVLTDGVPSANERQELEENLGRIEVFVPKIIEDLWAAVAQEQSAGEEIERTIRANPELTRWKQADRSLIAGGIALAERAGFDQAQCFRAYGGRRLAKRLGSIGAGPEETTLFSDWLWMNYTPSTGAMTMAESILLGVNLSAQERAILRRRRDSVVLPYQVVRIIRLEGIELQDLVTGRKVFVDDVACSTTGCLWAIMFARVYEAGPFTFMSALPRVFPPEYKPMIVKALIGDLENYMKEHPGATLYAFLKAHPEAIGHMIEDLLYSISRVPFQKMTNTEGHRIAPTSVRYDLKDPDLALTWLKAHPDFGAGEDDAEGKHFTWLATPGKRGRTILGNVTIKQSVLEFVCDSRQRAQRGKKLLSAIPGASVRLEVREDPRRFMQQAQQMWEVRHLIPKPDQQARDDALAKMSAAWKRKFYEEDWLISPIPALGGMTPKEAACNPNRRVLLVDLLRQFEFHEMSEPDAGKRYDIGRLRELLGITDA